MPRLAAIRLQPTQIASFGPRAKRYDVPDAICPGLSLRVSPTGGKSWRLFYRDGAGTLRRCTVGHWPAMTLKDARDKATDERRAFERDGIDPLKAKKAKRKEAKTEAENTVAALWEKYGEIEGRHLKSWHERVRQFKRDIAPVFGARPITEVNRADLRAWLDTRAAKAPVRANANYRTMRRFLEFCVERELLLVNPLARVKRPTNEVPRDRVLSAQELGATWTFLQQSHPLEDKELWLYPETVAALIVLLTSGQRLGAVARMSWADVVLEPTASATWRVPSEDSKNAEPHVVPLSPLAVDVLMPLAEKKHDARFVFALSPAEKHKVPEALRKRTVNPYWRVAAAAGPLRKALGFAFRLHDWRRSCATHLAQHGERPEVIAAVLGHKSVIRGTVTTRHYALYNYEREKRAALGKWAEVLVGYAAAEEKRVADCEG